LTPALGWLIKSSASSAIQKFILNKKQIFIALLKLKSKKKQIINLENENKIINIDF